MSIIELKLTILEDILKKNENKLYSEYVNSHWKFDINKIKEVFLMGISIFKECNLLKGTFYSMTQKDLKGLKASQFKEGDVIRVSNYYIHIKYGNFDTPSLCSYVEDNNFNGIDCTPGSSKGFTPYYINNFKNK